LFLFQIILLFILFLVVYFSLVKVLWMFGVCLIGDP
jgi:hypothetical protein